MNIKEQSTRIVDEISKLRAVIQGLYQTGALTVTQKQKLESSFQMIDRNAQQIREGAR